MSNIKHEYIMCRYGELSTKGKNRKSFVKQLLRNIKRQLREFESLKYRQTFDRLYINLHDEDSALVVEELKHVFGLSSFSLAVQSTREMSDMASLAVQLIKKEPGQTFKVITRRRDKSYEHSSDTVNRYIGGEILKNTDFKVDVHNPDVEVLVEIRENETSVMMGKIDAAGGYPVGTQSKTMMMLSGGIDSPVAAHLMMKRGSYLEFIHFASPPYTSEQALEKVLDLAKGLLKYQNNIRIHVIPFTDIQMRILDQGPDNYSITMMRRLMLRMTDRLAQSRKCLAIVNGESLGQVASQTLESIQAISDFPTLPILRPLITYDKIEIVNLAIKIGTYETSILPFEDACTVFTPSNPTTKPKDYMINHLEDKVDYEPLIQKALSEARVIDLVYKENNKEPSFL